MRVLQHDAGGGRETTVSFGVALKKNKNFLVWQWCTVHCTAAAEASFEGGVPAHRKVDCKVKITSSFCGRASTLQTPPARPPKTFQHTISLLCDQLIPRNF